MLATELLEDFFFLERGYLNGNHFVYRSAAPELVDTGYLRDFAETAAAIADLGVDLRRVRRIVATHTHCDHVGGNRRIQELSGCEIALHRIGKRFVEARDDWSTWWRYYGQEAEFFEPTQGLEDGAEVLFGPHRFQVLHTPGHAADGIVLYHPAARLLLSSDTLWERDVAVATVRVEGSRALLDWEASLERLEALDAGLVCPGHGPVFRDVRTAVARTRERLRAYGRDPSRVGFDLLKKIVVYTLLMKRSVPESSFFEHLMATHWFPETVEFYFGGEYRKAFGEVLGELLRRGVVVRADGGLRTTAKP